MEIPPGPADPSRELAKQPSRGRTGATPRASDSLGLGLLSQRPDRLTVLPVTPAGRTADPPVPALSRIYLFAGTGKRARKSPPVVLPSAVRHRDAFRKFIEIQAAQEVTLESARADPCRLVSVCGGMPNRSALTIAARNLAGGTSRTRTACNPRAFRLAMSIRIRPLLTGFLFVPGRNLHMRTAIYSTFYLTASKKLIRIIIFRIG